MLWIRMACMRCVGVAVVGVGVAVAVVGCTDTRNPQNDSITGPTGPGTEAGTETNASAGSNTSGVGSSASSGGAGGCTSNEACIAESRGSFCELQSGQCYDECAPASTRDCYSGPDAALGIGPCRVGTQTCTPQGTWDLWCAGEVVPLPDDCNANNVDDDCDGLVDDTDADGDGYGRCKGNDCCDIDGGGCSDAVLVNPGAFEFVGNRLDDNCNGVIDEVELECDAGLASDSTDANDFARAMELCSATLENPPSLVDKNWGLIDAQLTMADGSGVPFAVQHALRGAFGDLLTPRAGESMVVLSSGHAAAPSDTAPAFAPFQSGVNLSSIASAPASWLAANAGTFPNPAGCPEPWSTNANDSVMLTLRLRAPTNARSFNVKMNFFSAEYPEWVCSAFNDFFIALVDSDSTENPDDGNIAIYDDNGTAWPVGVNLVMVADGLFSQCQNGDIGCSTDLNASYGGCVGNALLEGTGFDLSGQACGGAQTQAGGATGWLTMSGNVVPGEVFEVRLAVWDSSGHILDSLVLLDQWQWSVDAADPGVVAG